jgi:hypothetical protein
MIAYRAGLEPKRCAEQPGAVGDHLETKTVSAGPRPAGSRCLCWRP